MPLYEFDLNALIGDCPDNTSRIMGLMLKMAEELNRHHRIDKVHGNLHSSNILFDSQLNSAHFFDALPPDRSTTYTSPETHFKGIKHAASDVWAMGILFIELLSGCLLDEGQFAMTDIPYADPFFPSERWVSKRVNNNKELCGLIMRMLGRDYK